jgi:tRNA A37 threonylcarbamoyladenosine biosynthesis protein TsaE
MTAGSVGLKPRIVFVGGFLGAGKTTLLISQPVNLRHEVWVKQQIDE